MSQLARLVGLEINFFFLTSLWRSNGMLLLQESSGTKQNIRSQMLMVAELINCLLGRLSGPRLQFRDESDFVGGKKKKKIYKKPEIIPDPFIFNQFWAFEAKRKFVVNAF